PRYGLASVHHVQSRHRRASRSSARSFPVRWVFHPILGAWCCAGLVGVGIRVSTRPPHAGFPAPDACGSVGYVAGGATVGCGGAVMAEGNGVAGASARHEYERRKAKDEAATREKWGRFGNIAVALTPERTSTRVWATGAEGEARVGARLDGIAS